MKYPFLSGIAGFCIFFGLGTIAATFGNSPIEAAGAYIAASICLLAHAIEKTGHKLTSSLQNADRSSEPQQPAAHPKKQPFTPKSELDESELI